jgi:hypothetical protein
MKKLWTVTVIGTLFITSVSYAQDKPAVTYLKQGDTAPWPGTLLNQVAAATMIADATYQQNKMQLALEQERKRLQLEYEKNFMQRDAEHEREVRILTATKTAAEERAIAAERLAVEASKPSALFYVTHIAAIAVGAGIGAAIVALIAK